MSGLRSVCAGLLLAAAACVPMLPAGTTTIPSSRSSAPAPAAVVEHEIHQIINQHRARRGLPALQYDERVAEVAREHSAAMAAGSRPFGHGGFEQRGSAISRFLPYLGLAENVAYDSRSGPTLPSLIATGWIGSAAHRQNIEGSYGITGIGIARDRDGVTYATQIFLRR
jgi:uncharacterized protein YkwD